MKIGPNRKAILKLANELAYHPAVHPTRRRAVRALCIKTVVNSAVERLSKSETKRVVGFWNSYFREILDGKSQGAK